MLHAIRIILQQLRHAVVVFEHEGLDQADTNAAPQEQISERPPLPVDRKHQRRPTVIFTIVTVDVRALLKQILEYVFTAVLDRHVQRLWPTTPERVRPPDIDRRGLLGNNPPHFVQVAATDSLEQRARSTRINGSPLRLNMLFQRPPAWEAVLPGEDELGVVQSRAVARQLQRIETRQRGCITRADRGEQSLRFLPEFVEVGARRQGARGR